MRPSNLSHRLGMLWPELQRAVVRLPGAPGTGQSIIPVSPIAIGYGARACQPKFSPMKMMKTVNAAGDTRRAVYAALVTAMIGWAAGETLLR